jgi:hypothetical protein
MVWDGITLKNSATVIPIIAVVTYYGHIVSELVDALTSQGSSGVDMAALVHGVLERSMFSQQESGFQITEQQLLTGCFGRAHVQPL